jgi:hypothetical protein
MHPVGRVLFNPPLHAKWRVKENPPYGLGLKARSRLQAQGSKPAPHSNSSVSGDFRQCGLTERSGLSSHKRRCSEFQLGVRANGGDI